jgi:hypothetical protein
MLRFVPLTTLIILRNRVPLLAGFPVYAAPGNRDNLFVYERKGLPGNPLGYNANVDG